MHKSSHARRMFLSYFSICYHIRSSLWTKEFRVLKRRCNVSVRYVDVGLQVSVQVGNSTSLEISEIIVA